MKIAKSLRSLLASAAILMSMLDANAATTTVTTSLPANTWTDLGAGPIVLGAVGGNVLYWIGDAAPSGPTAAHTELQGAPSVLVPTTAHVYGYPNPTGGSSGVSAVVTSGSGVVLQGGGGGGGGSVTQGTNPWSDNIAQFGGSVVVTGTGAGGAGVPRVTVSSDSSLTALQGGAPWSDNIAQLGGVALGGATGWGVSPSGNVPGVNANVLALPPLPTGSNVVGSFTPVMPSPAASANSHAVGAALSSSLVVKASAGNLLSANATAVTGGAAGYLVAVNATSAPTTGSAIAPLDFCYIATGAAGCSFSHGIYPIAYSTGIVLLVTTASSPFTYTSGTDTAALEADYK